MKTIIGFAHVQVGDVRIDLRRRNVAVAEQRLHRARIRAALQKVRRKAVAQSVRRNIRHARFGGVFLDDCPGDLSR